MDRLGVDISSSDGTNQKKYICDDSAITKSYVQRISVAGSLSIMIPMKHCMLQSIPPKLTWRNQVQFIIPWTKLATIVCLPFITFCFWVYCCRRFPKCFWPLASYANTETDILWLCHSGVRAGSWPLDVCIHQEPFRYPSGSKLYHCDLRLSCNGNGCHLGILWVQQYPWKWFGI